METMELYIGFYIFAIKYFCALKNHQKKKIMTVLELENN